MKKQILLTVFTLIIFSALKSQPGTLDKSFSKNGKELISKKHRAEAVLCLADGKILAGGAFDTVSTSYFSLSRYNSDGSFDSSFNNGKINIIRTSRESGTGILSMGLTADNKIIAVGSGNNTKSIVLARYNYDGTTDSSFGINGISEIDCRRFCFIGKMIILPHGRILICGSIKQTRFDTAQACLIRIQKNGIIDNRFGESGFVKANVAPYHAGVFNALTLQPDGKIIAVGAAAYFGSNNNFLTARFKSNGAPDASFGTNGIVVTPLNNLSSSATAVEVLQSNRIVVAGSSFGSMAVVKYLPKGLLDDSFNITGSNIIQFANEVISVSDMVVQDNRKIVVCGYTQSGNEILASINQKGELSPGFGNNGQTVTSYSSSIYHNAMALLADGKIIVAGSAINQNNAVTHISIARYFGDISSDDKIEPAILNNKKISAVIKAEY